MIEEHLALLTKYICSRYPYFHFMVKYGDEDYNVIGVGFGRATLVKPFMSYTSGSPLIEEVKPYLRPMDTMTEQEREEYLAECDKDDDTLTGQVYHGAEYLEKKMFDFRGLITIGLALPAKEGMYKYV